MKFIFAGIVFALLNLSFLDNDRINKNEEGIEFSELSFSEALKQAKVSNKLIFLDAYASWCGPCKWMEANTFKSEKVGEIFNDNFINLKIDMEKGEGPELAKRYKVTAYPTMFFINSKGEVVHKVLGAKKEKDFIKEAETVLL